MAISNQIVDTITNASTDQVKEAFMVLAANHLPFLAVGLLIIILSVGYLIYSHMTRVRESKNEKGSTTLLNEMQRSMGDIAVILNSELKDIKITLAKLEQAKIKDCLQKLLKLQPDADGENPLLKQSEEHQLRVEERIEQIAEIVKQNNSDLSANAGNSADSAQLTAETQKLNDLLEKQSLYLKEELNTISNKIQELTAVQAQVATQSNSEISADAGNSADSAQFATETQKLNDLLEKQSLYLKEELDTISNKIQELTAAQAQVAASAAITDPAQIIAPAATADAPQNVNNAIEIPTQIHAALSEILEKVSELQAQPQASNGGGGEPGIDYSKFFEMIAQSMNRLSGEVDAKLTLLNGKLEKNMEARWSDTLVSINNMREQIQSLSETGEQMKHISKNVTSLSRMLLTRAGIGDESGRQQLAELLPQILSSEHFQLDFDLPNGHCAAALVRFPDPRDSVAIDASISIKTFFDTMEDGITPAERDNKQQIFRRELANHVNYVADNLIFPPHTGESALLFVPSEAAFASIHAHHRAVVQLALSRRVWLVSPTTLLAVLNTANTAIKDHQAHLQLQQLQATVSQIIEEAQHFENRLTEIGDHVNSAWRSVQRAENASGRLIGSIRNISQPHESNIPITPPTTNDTPS